MMRGVTQPPTPPPPVDPRVLRPGRGWYAVAGVVVVLGVLAGVGLFAFGIVSLVRGLPKMKTEFRAGTSATVALTADRTWAVYTDEPVPDSGTSTCTGAASGDATIRLTEPSATFTFDRGRRHWRLVYRIRVSRDGTYELTCRPVPEANGGQIYAVGDDVQVGGFVAKVFGSIAALLGLPCLALVAGAVIALVTALRRNSHKKRLQTRPPPEYPPPGYPTNF
jgi:hypothetical protein